MTGPAVLGRHDGPAYRITLNRPEVRNALDGRAFADLHSHLDIVDADRAIRAVIVTGAGDQAFCAGADVQALEDLSGGGAERVHRFLADAQRLFQRVETLGRPVVAALNGHALGGGLELALACTFVIAAEGARLGLPEARLGLIPGIGGTQRLARRVGHATALRMLLTGEIVDATHGHARGLVDDPPVPRADLDALVADWVRRLASTSPWSGRLILESMAAVAAVSPSSLAHETALAALAAMSTDAEEGIRAFREKRPPEFR